MILNLTFLISCSEYQRVVDKFPDGNIKEVYIYKDPEMEVLLKKQIFFDTGDLYCEIIFDSVQYEKVASPYPIPKSTGYKITYNPDGSKIQEGYVDDDFPIGTQKAYYSNGNLNLIFNNDTGELLSEYYENGQLKEKKDLSIPLHEMYYETGELKAKIFHRDPPFRIEKRNYKGIMFYKREQNEDSAYYYYKSGELMFTSFSVNDLIIEHKYFNQNGDEILYATLGRFELTPFVLKGFNDSLDLYQSIYSTTDSTFTDLLFDKDSTVVSKTEDIPIDS